MVVVMKESKVELKSQVTFCGIKWKTTLSLPYKFLRMNMMKEMKRLSKWISNDYYNQKLRCE